MSAVSRCEAQISTGQTRPFPCCSHLMRIHNLPPPHGPPSPVLYTSHLDNGVTGDSLANDYRHVRGQKAGS